MSNKFYPEGKCQKCGALGCYDRTTSFTCDKCALEEVLSWRSPDVRDYPLSTSFIKSMTFDPTSSNWVVGVDWGDTATQFLESREELAENRRNQVADAFEAAALLGVDTGLLDELSAYQYNQILRACKTYGG